jgi:hypothetical protein
MSKMKTAFIALSLLAVIAIAGCPAMPFEIPWITPAPMEKIEKPPEILAIRELSIIPTPPIVAESSFTLSFIVANTDEREDVEDVNVTLYDWGICNLRTGEIIKKELGTLARLSERYVAWELEAPPSALIVDTATCPLKWKIDYNMTAKSQVEINVIDEERLRALQRAGEPWQVTPTQTIGAGPLKISFEFVEPQPFKNESSFIMFLQVENKGPGAYPAVPTWGLYLKIPEEFEGSCDDFYKTLIPETIGGIKYNIYKNTRIIDLIKGKTPKIKCTFTAPKVDVMKTYLFLANLSYGYALHGRQDITVRALPG